MDTLDLPIIGYVVLAEGVDMTVTYTAVNAWLVAMASATVHGSDGNLPWIVPVVSTKGWLVED